MEHTTCHTQHATHVMENTQHGKKCTKCNAATVIGVTGRHSVPDVVDLGTVTILTVPLPFTGHASWKGDRLDDSG